MSESVVFSDGGCIGNPGPGGWAAIVFAGGTYRELGGGEKETTNNRMELTAAIKGIEAAPTGPVKVVTDSRYLVDGATKWIYGWKKKGWIKSDGGGVLNRDLWEMIDRAISVRKITWEHVYGHSGHPENERCDFIANTFARGGAPELKTGDGSWIFASPKAPPAGTGEPDEKYPKPLYLSVVDGDISEHATWPECEARIKGRKGARCKKVASRREHVLAIEAWKDLA